jgi:hypothetical protein
MPSVRGSAEPSEVAPPATPSLSAFDDRALHRTHSGLGPSAPTGDFAVDAPRPAALGSRSEVRDDSEARAAALVAAFEAGSPAHETPIPRGAEGKVIRFPASQRKDEEAPDPSVRVPAAAAPAVAARSAEAEAAPPPFSAVSTPEPASVNISPMRVVTQGAVDAAREAAAVAVAPAAPASEYQPVSASHLVASEHLSGPSALTEREPAVARAAERLAADPSTTMTFGSPFKAAEAQTELNEPIASQEPAPTAETVAAVSSVESSHTQEAHPAPSTPEQGFGDDVHEEFFSAGETGAYEDTTAPPGRPDLHSFESEEEAPRVLVRTPAQEARRERNIKYVSLAVGLALAIPCVAYLRSRHQAQSPDLGLEPGAAPATVAPEPSAAVAPSAAPPAEVAPPVNEVIPSPPPEVSAAPPASPEAEPPALVPTPALPPEVAAKPAAPKAAPAPAPVPNVEAAPKAKPKAVDQPKAPAEPPPAASPPSGKPPTAAFPL